MASIRLIIDWSEVTRMFSDMAERTDLEHGLGEEIHKILLADALRQFQAGGIDPAWQPLARETIAEKKRIGYPRLNRFGLVPMTATQNGGFGPSNILIRTTALLSSWTSEHDPDHFVKITKDGVESGSTLAYAQFHQDPKPGSRLPKRAIGVTDQAQREIADLVQNYIVGGQS